MSHDAIDVVLSLERFGLSGLRGITVRQDRRRTVSAIDVNDNPELVSYLGAEPLKVHPLDADCAPFTNDGKLALIYHLVGGPARTDALGTSARTGPV